MTVQHILDVAPKGNGDFASPSRPHRHRVLMPVTVVENATGNVPDHHDHQSSSPNSLRVAGEHKCGDGRR